MANKLKSDVIIIGGGMVGLSAAHELAKGGVDCSVIEKSDALGGKMRSFYDDQKKYLGEHGFRIFSSQYYNVFSHMQQIGAADSFQEIGLWECLPQGGCIGKIHKRTGIAGFLVTLQSICFKLKHWGLKPCIESIKTLQHFAEASTLDASKVLELDNCSAFDYLKLAEQSEEVQYYFCNMFQAINGVDIRKASIYGLAQQFKLFFQNASKLSSNSFLFTLKSPTEDLINKWVQYQEKMGVTFLKNNEVTQCLFHSQSNTLEQIVLSNGEVMQAQAFIMAVPLDVAVDLVPEAIPAKELLSSLEVYNGVQIHVKKSTHYKALKSGYLYQLYDSPWKIAIIIQDREQWPNYVPNCISYALNFLLS